MTMTEGRSIRAAAFSIPGTILSQEPMYTTPSNTPSPTTMASMESVMISLWGRQYRIPECPWAIPSHMATVLNSMGSPPASRIPFFTSSASCFKGSCPGHISFQLLATAMSGLWSRESMETPADARWALDMAFWNGSNLSIARNIISSC